MKLNPQECRSTQHATTHVAKKTYRDGVNKMRWKKLRSTIQTLALFIAAVTLFGCGGSSIEPSGSAGKKPENSDLSINTTRAKSFRNVFGYISGLATSTGNVSSVIIKDNQSGKQYNGTVHWFWAAPQKLRWYCNNLPTDRGYTVTVTPNYSSPDDITEQEAPPQSKSFYLPSQWNNDQRVDEFVFNIN